MEKTNIKEKLEKLLGVREAHEIIKLLAKVKSSEDNQAAQEVDRIARIINKKIPQIEYRYKQLTANTPEALEKIKVLAYLVKDVTVNIN
ncbi:MAG: hypothetical protein ABIA04_15625 [Pseudomonadota bacterium]